MPLPEGYTTIDDDFLAWVQREAMMLPEPFFRPFRRAI